ncbi:MAG: hypothetical protein JWM11_4874 [Planctomycetaceae bacterium]|nr:hypothetical protein [Planctomycetaceae bacterium]
MANPALDAFGKLLITKVRDRVINDWRMIIDGRMKGDRAKLVRKEFALAGDKAKDMLAKLLPEIVDTVLHHFLSLVEEEEQISLGIRVGKTGVSDLREVSDGLAGEIYGDKGWIAKFGNDNT